MGGRGQTRRAVGRGEARRGGAAVRCRPGRAQPPAREGHGAGAVVAPVGRRPDRRVAPAAGGGLLAVPPLGVVAAVVLFVLLAVFLSLVVLMDGVLLVLLPPRGSSLALSRLRLRRRRGAPHRGPFEQRGPLRRAGLRRRRGGGGGGVRAGCGCRCTHVDGSRRLCPGGLGDDELELERGGAGGGRGGSGGCGGAALLSGALPPQQLDGRLLGRGELVLLGGGGGRGGRGAGLLEGLLRGRRRRAARGQPRRVGDRPAL